MTAQATLATLLQPVTPDTVDYAQFKNWFMLSMRISSYGCMREVRESMKEA